LSKTALTHYSSLITRYFPFLWLLLLAAYILAGTPLVPFHGDESTQVYMSRDYAYQFLQGDLSKITYRDPPVSAQEQELRLLNGTVNKYLIGLSWHLSGFTLADINEQWDWGGDWNYNQQNNHAPSPALLLAARWPSAVLLAAGVIVIFALGQILGGRLTAYLASAYYALNPALLLDGRRAMMEGSLTFFSLLTVLAGVWFLRRPTWLRALGLGAAAGLALASKHTALFTLAAVFAGCFVYVIVNPHPEFGVGRKQSERPVTHSGTISRFRGVFLTGLAALIMVIVFLALNPAWWGNPLARAGKVLELRQNLLVGQTAAFGGYSDAADQVAGFLRQSFVVLPQYYEVPAWSGFIGDQIAAYEASPWYGVSLGGSTVGAIVLAALAALGAWWLVRDSGNGEARWIVGLWTLVIMASTLVLTPIEWQRYYVPVYPAVGLLAALGLKHLTQRSRDTEKQGITSADSHP